MSVQCHINQARSGRPLVFEDQLNLERVVEVAAEHSIEMPLPIAW